MRQRAPTGKGELGKEREVVRKIQFKDQSGEQLSKLPEHLP